MKRRLSTILALCLVLALTGCNSHISKEETIYSQETAAGEITYFKPSHPAVKALLAQLEGYAKAAYTIDYQTTNGQEEYEFYTPEFREWRIKEGEDKIMATIYEEQQYKTQYLGPIEVHKVQFNEDLTKCEVSYSFKYELSATQAAFTERELPGPGTYQLDDHLWFWLVDGKWYVHDYATNVTPVPVTE